MSYVILFVKGYDSFACVGIIEFNFWYVDIRWVSWPNYWLVGLSIDWLIDWLIDWMVIDLLIYLSALTLYYIFVLVTIRLFFSFSAYLVSFFIGSGSYSLWCRDHCFYFIGIYWLVWVYQIIIEWIINSSVCHSSVISNT